MTGKSRFELRLAGDGSTCGLRARSPRFARRRDGGGRAALDRRMMPAERARATLAADSARSGPSMSVYIDANSRLHHDRNAALR